MSLFIRGVFMPKEGESRTFNLQNGIIEILSPHGRLIDADELIKKLERHRDMCGDIETQYGIDTAIRILRNIPTIIEAEVSE